MLLHTPPEYRCGGGGTRTHDQFYLSEDISLANWATPPNADFHGADYEGNTVGAVHLPCPRKERYGKLPPTGIEPAICQWRQISGDEKRPRRLNVFEDYRFAVLRHALRHHFQEVITGEVRQAEHLLRLHAELISDFVNRLSLIYQTLYDGFHRLQ